MFCCKFVHLLVYSTQVQNYINAKTHLCMRTHPFEPNKKKSFAQKKRKQKAKQTKKQINKQTKQKNRQIVFKSGLTQKQTSPLPPTFFSFFVI